MEVSGKFHAPTAFYPGTPWIGGWVGLFIVLKFSNVNLSLRYI